MIVEPASIVLLRHGRFLTPGSKARYRVERLRRGKVSGVEDVPLLAVLTSLIALPTLGIVDLLTWPLLQAVAGRRTWWIVELRWHEHDAEFVRVAECTTKTEAVERLRSMRA